MRALTVIPEQAGSLELVDMPEPDASLGDVLVQGLAVGVCGTDREICDGLYGEAPAGSERLILGHESLGRVLEAPVGGPFAPGDLVVGIVRHPDPVPCGACAHGEWDMCRNGRFTEHGIKGLPGFGAERWRVRSDHAVTLNPQLEDVGVLLEPTTVVAKAWEQADKVGGRAWFDPQTALITGAGPIGLLGAMIGVQRGLDVHVLDHNTTGPKPRLVAELGATYHSGDPAEVLQQVRPDVILEGTGALPVISAVFSANIAYGVTVLTGISAPKADPAFDLGAVNRNVVLDNAAIVGSVNANRRHYELAADALAAADLEWLRRIITRRVPLADYAAAFERHDGDVKVVITLS